MSTTVKAHGLDGTLVEPDWPPLTVAEVRALLDRFDEGEGPVEILSASPRPFSAAGVVRTRRGKLFVKRHHRLVRDGEGLHEEHRFMAHLRDAGASLPLVLAAKSGETAIEAGDWTYEVHETGAGLDLYEEAQSWTPFRSVQHAYSAGRMLARLHLASQGYAAPGRTVRPLVAGFTIFAESDPHAEMDLYLSARPTLARDETTRRACGEALELLAPFHAELQPLLPALTPLWTHNDLHPSNLLWSDAGAHARAAAVIDFGLADRTNVVHDLAHALERSIVEWLALFENLAHPEAVPTHIEDLHALLAGYESVRPLSPWEAAALAPMIAVCHAEFALSEADYFLGVLQSKEKARVATVDYLVGHARWFRSRGGTRFLDSVARWAESRIEARGVAKR
jgi:Ser/Thr protein kinase RdoA (MazF antagonist)